MTAAVALVPALRDELSLHPGPVADDGSPTYVLRDPVRHRFFRIGWAAFEILARWHLGDPDRLAETVRAETTLSVGPDDVVEVARFLAANQLLRADSPVDSRRLAAIARFEKPGVLVWLLHHYLFFRIPLVRPDRLLGAIAPYVGWLGGRVFRLVTLAALAVGLELLFRHWGTFAAALSDSFNWQGATAFGVSLALAKLVHEMAHALAAKRLGCRVGSMGIAFLVMWPVLYTDVNETWMLPRRRDRLTVGAAGILAELTLGAWATLAWGLLSDGPLRQGALALATTIWVSSLMLNLSPFMRFDGYFLLMDAFDMPNLHARAFALARWWLRERLFGLGEAAPEPLPEGKRTALIAFAWVVWLYRLVVFLGIAVLVYHFFIKVVGIGLFCVEIGWFVVLPVWRELADWRQRGRSLFVHWRGKATAALVLLALISLFVPVDSEVAAPAMLEARDRIGLFAPGPARIEAVLASDRQAVTAGQTLFRLGSPDLEHRRAQAARRAAVTEQELRAAGFNPALRQRTRSLREELEADITERLAAERELTRLTVVAPVAGTVVDLDPNLTAGQWVSPKSQLAAVIGDGPAEVVAYVDEDAVERIAIGATAKFFATAPGWPPIRARVVAIDRRAVLHLDAPALASISHGPIAVRPGDRALTPEQAVYKVRLTTERPAPLSESVGTAHIAASGSSVAARVWRAVAGVVLRESGM